MSKPKYGKTIPSELAWLRTFTAGDVWEPIGCYSPNRLRQLIELGAFIPTSDPLRYTLGAITDDMIKAAS